MKYNVYDTCGKLVKANFPTWKAAFTFLIMNQRYDWTIVKHKTK